VGSKEAFTLSLSILPFRPFFGNILSTYHQNIKENMESFTEKD